MAEGSQEGLKLFGFEIKRAKDKSDEKRPSIVPPRDDEGGSYATASGTHYGQYLNLDGDDSKWFSALFMALNNFARREFMHLPPHSLVQRNQDYHR